MASGASRFDPLNLTTSASLNRARIVDLPGIVPDPDVRGHAGYDLLSGDALSTAIAAHATELGLDTAADPAELLLTFDPCLGTADPRIRAVANDLARQFGRSLGYLLLTLRRGDPINRDARHDWDAGAWAYWAAARTVWLGGGIASGRLGAHLRKHAFQVLQEDGAQTLAVQVAKHARLLPLIGAARSLPASSSGSPTEAALVVDFGGTNIKCAIALYQQGALSALSSYPAVPTDTLTTSLPNESTASAEAGQHLAERMADVIARSWRAASSTHMPLSPHVVASIACYVRDGHPMAQPVGVYKELSELPLPAAEWLARLVSERVGHHLTVTLLHDGTAAARTYAGESHAAVIMLGTALGVGYPPPSRDGLRALAGGFKIHS